MKDCLEFILNNKILLILIKFILTFVVIFVVEYFLVVKKALKSNDKTTSEVNLILINYNIDIHKIDYKKFLYIISLFISFLLAIIISICFSIFNRTVWQILTAVLVAVPLGILGLDLIGNYFEKHQDFVDPEYEAKQKRIEYYKNKARKEQNKKKEKNRKKVNKKNTK